MDRLMMDKQRHDRPNRIILVRHGESEGNVNRSLYTVTPDSQIRLTAHGFEQGLAAGKQIRSIVGDESVTFLYSPYMRTRQTLLGILHSWRGRKVELIAEPGLREQDFGNFQDEQVMQQCYEERRRFGRLWYRFPSGEAGSDVYGRVGDLWQGLRRRIDHPRDRPPRNLVLVTHGLLMRFLCMNYLGWTEHEFEQVWNPSNGEIWVLDKDPRRGRYRLCGRWDERGGAFRPIRFGPTQRQTPYPHMMEVSPGRRFVLPQDPTPLLQAHLRVPVPSRRSSSRILQRYDADSNGLLELEEFTRLARELEAPPEAGCSWTDGEIQSAFRRHDTNGSGKLDHRELRQALRSLGADVKDIGE